MLPLPNEQQLNIFDKANWYKFIQEYSIGYVDNIT
jgi:hypothetical protein